MLTEAQRAAFQHAIEQICPSMARTWRGKEGKYNLWECDKCGTIVKDDPTRSRLGWFHQKPGQEQSAKCSCGRDFSACDYPDC